MELECEKYHEKIDSEQAACRHSGDYCQYRTSCMIHFIEKDNVRNLTDVTVRNGKKEQAKE